MPIGTSLRRRRIGPAIPSIAACAVFACAALAAEDPAPASSCPWGVSRSASSFRNHAERLPVVASAGVRSVPFVIGRIEIATGALP